MRRHVLLEAVGTLASMADSERRVIGVQGRRGHDPREHFRRIRNSRLNLSSEKALTQDLILPVIHSQKSSQIVRRLRSAALKDQSNLFAVKILAAVQLILLA